MQKRSFHMHQSCWHMTSRWGLQSNAHATVCHQQGQVLVCGAGLVCRSRHQRNLYIFKGHSAETCGAHHGMHGSKQLLCALLKSVFFFGWVALPAWYYLLCYVCQVRGLSDQMWWSGCTGLQSHNQNHGQHMLHPVLLGWLFHASSICHTSTATMALQARVNIIMCYVILLREAKRGID